MKECHIEITTFCNAACPGCGRNSTPIRPSHLPLEKWSELVNDGTFDGFSALVFDGNFGDFSMHPHALEFLNILASRNSNLNVEISTNGGANTLKFWSSIVECLTKFREHSVLWGISGLEDTNHIHRKNVKWDKLVANFREFIANGGNAIFSPILFKHNLHQLADMSSMAKSEGFSTFKIRQSYSQSIQDDGNTLEKVNFEDFTYAVQNFSFGIPSLSHKNTTIDTIRCYNQRKQIVYLDEYGLFRPCCWVSHDVPRTIATATKFTEDIFSTDTFKIPIIEDMGGNKSLMGKCEACPGNKHGKY